MLHISHVTLANDSAVSGNSPTETVPKCATAPFASGYARSKRVAELLCDAAARQLCAPITVLRTGQVPGFTSQRGAIWNRDERLPSLVIGSLLSLRYLPDSLGPWFSEVDWVPSDLLGAVVVDLILAPVVPNTMHADGAAEVFNVWNPNTVFWSETIPAIQKVAKNTLSYDIHVVTSTEWLDKPQEAMETDYSDLRLQKDTPSQAPQPLLRLWPPAIRFTICLL
ncbi:hypothetical protein HD806DRAFT_536152 [Xylariaceae sp. AK1471]|nr:hypothetical protein HD806DRAFT_536152 [Xylariaceae sp. AK1471]